MFESVLIANRGEIAVRVIRTAHALGYRTVAVYSDADRDAPHVTMADDALRIGPAAVNESYLDGARIIEAALRAGADAVHPGYGFLSENAAFAQQVLDAGLVWIGPPPSAIDAMGDKTAAKLRMRAAEVPCVPGYEGEDPDDEVLTARAAEVGYPLLVKAAAGGGGRGMRRVDNPGQLADALRSARAEARNAFGSERLLLERYVTQARHVEVQVMADAHGEVIHLGERDCSVQRRHQKVVEEAPSPGVSPEVRARMGAAACAAARAVGYVGAGTVEFLLDADGESFYFLEMNTRLQVEHPVTEEITGLDLVALQLHVAAGLPLPLTQDEVRLEGHAIEVRLYAEDPAAGYLPQAGPVLAWAPSEAIRVDHGLSGRGRITADYDPMVAKLIAAGPDRETARRRLLRALDTTIFFGPRNNRGLLQRVLAHPTFVQGEATTGFLDANASLADDPELDDETRAVAVALWVAQRGHLDGFRTGHLGEQTLSLDLDGGRLDAAIVSSPGAVSVRLVGEGLEPGPWSVSLRQSAPGQVRRRVSIDGHERTVHVHDESGELRVRHRQRDVSVTLWDPTPVSAEAASDGKVRMPMAGKVLSVEVTEGQRVEVGQVVAIVEAMKLETSLKADVAGEVTAVRLGAGEAAGTGAVVVVIEAESAEGRQEGEG